MTNQQNTLFLVNNRNCNTYETLTRNELINLGIKHDICFTYYESLSAYCQRYPDETVSSVCELIKNKNEKDYELLISKKVGFTEYCFKSDALYIVLETDDAHVDEITYLITNLSEYENYEIFEKETKSSL